MYSLGTVIVVGFFVILYLLVMNIVPESNREVLNILLGALVGSFGSIVQYFYGSSQGSREKTDLMSDKKEKL